MFSQGVRMKIPTKIFIEGKEWTITRKWRIEQDGESLDGLCVFSKRQILVVHGLKEDEAFHAFIHEYLHAVLHERGYYLTSRTSDAEELIVHALQKELCESFVLKPRKHRSK